MPTNSGRKEESPQTRSCPPRADGVRSPHRFRNHQLSSTLPLLAHPVDGHTLEPAFSTIPIDIECCRHDKPGARAHRRAAAPGLFYRPPHFRLRLPVSQHRLQNNATTADIPIPRQKQNSHRSRSKQHEHQSTLLMAEESGNSEHPSLRNGFKLASAVQAIATADRTASRANNPRISRI